MFILESRIFTLKGKWVYFADRPTDLDKCDFVHFDFCNSDREFEGFITIGRQLTAVIDLNQSLDTIWRNMSELWRRSIKRAEEANIDININRDYKDYWKMNRAFELRTGLYERLSIEREIAFPSVATMKKYGTLFTAQHNGKILAGNIYIEDEAHIRLWRSASMRLQVDKEKTLLVSRANRLLHWEAIKYAKGKGIKEYDLGGLWTEEEMASDPGKQASLNFFKLGTGAKLSTRRAYRKVYSKAYRLGQYLYGLIKPDSLHLPG